jgi:hypothetical protein
MERRIRRHSRSGGSRRSRPPGDLTRTGGPGREPEGQSRSYSRLSCGCKRGGGDAEASRRTPTSGGQGLPISARQIFAARCASRPNKGNTRHCTALLETSERLTDQEVLGWPQASEHCATGEGHGGSSVTAALIGTSSSAGAQHSGHRP